MIECACEIIGLVVTAGLLNAKTVGFDTAFQPREWPDTRQDAERGCATLT